MSDPTALTTARVGLGRRGVSLPTSAMLSFQADHAAARDAVHADFEVDTVRTALTEAGIESVTVTTGTRQRGEYLRRPGLGRRLSEQSRSALASGSGVEVAVILSDGRVVDDFLAPDADRVLAAMKALGA